MQHEKLMVAGEVAEMLGVQKCTIYQWTSRGIIPVIRFSARCVKFSPAALATWIASKSCSSGPQHPEAPAAQLTKKQKAAKNINVSGARIDAIVDRAKKEVLACPPSRK